MKAEQMHYDAALQGARGSSYLNPGQICSAVDAALDLVPVVELTEALAERVRDAYLQNSHPDGNAATLAALRATLPASFVLAGEFDKTEACYEAQVNVAEARAEAAEKRVVELEDERKSAQDEPVADGLRTEIRHLRREVDKLTIERDIAQAELARLREAHGLLAQDYAGADADRQALSGELARLQERVKRFLNSDDALEGACEQLRQAITPSTEPAPVPATGAAFQVTEEEWRVWLKSTDRSRYPSEYLPALNSILAKRAAQGQVVPRVVRELPAKWRKEVADSHPEDAETTEDRAHTEGFCDALTFAAGDLERAISDAPVSVPASAPAADAATTGERPKVTAERLGRVWSALLADDEDEDEDAYNPTPEECARVVKALGIDVPAFAAEIRARVAAYKDATPDAATTGERPKVSSRLYPGPLGDEHQAKLAKQAADALAFLTGERDDNCRTEGCLGCAFPRTSCLLPDAGATPAAPPAGELVERVARLERWFRDCALYAARRDGCAAADLALEHDDTVPASSVSRS